MEIKQFAKLLRRWSAMLLLSMIVAGTTAYLLTQQAVPVYEASTTVLINQAPIHGTFVDINTLRTSESLAKTYAELLRKQPVMEAVVANLKLSTSPENLTKRIWVRSIQDTQLLEVTAEASDPRLAANIANETVAAFIQQNHQTQANRYAAAKASLQKELSQVQTDIDNTEAEIQKLGVSSSPEVVSRMGQLRSLLAQHRRSYTTLLSSFQQVRLAEAQMSDNLNVVEVANPPKTPVHPNVWVNTLLAAMVGAMGVLGLAFVREILDDSVKLSEDVERLTGVPTLAAIAHIKGASISHKLVTLKNSRSPIAEAYRMLRTNIAFCAIDRPMRTIVVTSSSPVEGKSITVANLAIALAQTGKRIILVDTDLRRPTLHEYFQRTNRQGVTTALLRQKEEHVSDHMISSGVENLLLMPSGPLPPNPAELLGSQRMNELIEDLKAQADVVLFDSPPLLHVVDASLLAHTCDATLLVVLAASTRVDALVKVKEQLLQSGAFLVGAVLNSVPSSSGHYPQSSSQRLERYIQWWRRLSAPFFRGNSG